MAFDLSTANANGLKLILLKVPVKDLIKSCTRVSKRWNGILEDNDFWRNKMEEDGYLWPDKMCENGNKFEWKIFAGLPTKLFKSMALKHCFERNFIKDSWNLDEPRLTLDPRWDADLIWQRQGPARDVDRIEIPPKFVDGGPEIPPEFAEPIPVCIAIHFSFSKKIVIKLADEGLTDEIMDNFRPTIFVTEMVANRRDCDFFYKMQCSLDASRVANMAHFPTQLQEYHNERRDENGHWIAATVAKRFKKGDDERWHRVELTFTDYPIGMRYLTLDCWGRGHNENPPDQYGLKLANCSVKALCEKNAPE